MAPSNALQLVQLSQLVDNVAESAYRGLQGLSQTLPALSDEERYRCTATLWHSMSPSRVIRAWKLTRVTCWPVSQEACFVAAPSQHTSEASAPSRACGVVQQGTQPGTASNLHIQTSKQHHTVQAFPATAKLLAEMLRQSMNTHCSTDSTF